MADKITGKALDIVTFLMGDGIDKSAIWELTRYKQKRSNPMNSYYWVLIGEIARKTHISSTQIHNQNLRDLGLVERMNEQLVTVFIPDTEEAEKQILNEEKYHLKPTSQIKTGKDGQVFRCYVMLRGSSTFNTEEFHSLLQLAIQEAQAQDIETMTPSEIAHMKALELAHEQKNKSNLDSTENKASS